MINWKSPIKHKLNDASTEENNNVSFVIQPTGVNNIPSDNKIFLYSEINKDTILGICKQIDDISKQLKLMEFTYDLKELPPIKLYINSEGGDLYSALVLTDKIIKSKLKIHTYIQGICASASTLISVVGHKRYINTHSYMLLHQLSTNWYGTYSTLLDEKQNCDLLMGVIKSIYLKYTKFSQKNLNELLKHDLLLDSGAALDLGLVDEII